MGITASCTYDTFLVEDNHANVTLSLSIGDEAVNVSRASVEDEGAENVIKTIELFFYGTNDVIYVPNEELSLNNGIISLSMLEEDFQKLGSSCQVYAIVNRVGDLPTDYSLASLRKMVISSSFVDENDALQAQESFVMDGLATVTCASNALTGTINVERVAVKVGLTLVNTAGNSTEELSVKEKRTVNGEEVEVTLWTATTGDVNISLRRGASSTYLGSTHYDENSEPIEEDYVYSVQPADVFSTAYTPLVTTVEGVSKYASFYTYPTNWENNENARTHIMLSVNWTKADGSKEKRLTYYEINVNPAAPFTERNNFYQIKQQISVLGSEEEDTPLELKNSSYNVVPWQTTAASTGSLSRPKYLMVEETTISLRNVETKRIYFSSSDPIDLINNDLTINWDYTKPSTAQVLTLAKYNNAQKSTLANGDIQYIVSNRGTPVVDKTTTTVSGVTNRIQGDYKVTITIHNANPNDANDRSYIEVNHPLKNLMDATSDYSRYFINFGVQHQGNDDYKETIKITQYPMLSIVADQNSSGPNETNGGDGYVFINGSNTSRTDWERVAGGLTNNTCPNRYIVSVSTLNNTDAGKNYIIGDPRTEDREITVNGRDLSNYLPADVNVNPKMISPEFMFASSYGQCPAFINKEKAERRCATYQEDGYPAGRWRLPSEAEVKYAIQLYKWGIIPQLFSENVNYWSANGKINGNGVNNGNSYYNGEQVAVRCVYDTWYWGTEHNAKSTKWTYKDTRD